jgi:hypothetical protein
MENLFEGQNWDTTRETLLDGLEGNKRDVMSSVLENTKQHLQKVHQLAHLVPVTLLL